MKTFTTTIVLLCFVSQAYGMKAKTQAEKAEFQKFLTEYQVTSTNADIDANTLRLHKKKGAPFPPSAKCQKYDYRAWNNCFQFRVFEPSARVYFDTGTDDPDEIDIFNDGALTASIDVGAIYWPWRLGRSDYFDNWHFGPLVAVGIGSPAGDPPEGEEQASSNAPVVYVSYGFLLDYTIGKKDDGNSLGFEIGGATGFSSDETLGDNDDTAIYVGFKLSLKPFKP